MAQPTTSRELLNKQADHGAVDPNVKIPKSVLEAGLRSEAIQRAISGDAEKSVAAQVDDGRQPRREEPPPSETPSEETPPAQQEPPSQQEPHPDDGRPVDWERQFKSLQGRYEGELRRSRDSIAVLSERLERAEMERNQLKNFQPPPPDQSQGGKPGNGSTSLTEQEIADYGPEFVDVMRRVAAETAAPLQHEIQNLRGQLGYVQAESGNAFLTRMNTTIGNVIPNWAELNKDAKFIAWSQLPDVFSGAIRKSLMQDAWNSGDPNRVIAFFQAFLAEEAATDPQGRGQRTPPPSRMVVSDSPVNPPTPGAPLDLGTLAAPGRAHSAGGTPAEKPVYTAAEITKFYTDVKLGRWRGREQQQAAIDHDIMLAQREGRIFVDQRTQSPRDPYQR